MDRTSAQLLFRSERLEATTPCANHCLYVTCFILIPNRYTSIERKMVRLGIGAASTAAAAAIATFLAARGNGVSGSFVEGETINHGIAPPCAKFPTLMWGGREAYFGEKNKYESRR